MSVLKKDKLITLEHVSGLYGDLRGRILDVESSLGVEIDEVKDSLENIYASKSELNTALASKFDSNNIATHDGSGTVDTDIVKMMTTVKNSLSTNPT